MDSDLKMAVSNTFSSILGEIQLPNLNYSIHMTPFAANITLKKSSQKDHNDIGSVDHFYDFWIQKSHHFYDFWIQKSSNPFSQILDPETAVILQFLDP